MPSRAIVADIGRMARTQGKRDRKSLARCRSDDLTIELDVQFVEAPLPRLEAAHAVYPLPADVGSEQRAEPVPPEPHRLVANIYPALEQEILDIAQAERIENLHHHYQPDHLGRRVEIAGHVGFLGRPARLPGPRQDVEIARAEPFAGLLITPFFSPLPPRQF